MNAAEARKISRETHSTITDDEIFKRIKQAAQGGFYFCELDRVIISDRQTEMLKEKGYGVFPKSWWIRIEWDEETNP